MLQFSQNSVKKKKILQIKDPDTCLNRNKQITKVSSQDGAWCRRGSYRSSAEHYLSHRARFNKINVSVTFILLTLLASVSAEKISRVIFHRHSTWLRMLTRRYRSRQLVKVRLNLPEHRTFLKDGPSRRSAKKTCLYRVAGGKIAWNYQ